MLLVHEVDDRGRERVLILPHGSVVSYFTSRDDAPGVVLRKIIESDRSFSSNPDSHFHRKRTPVFMRVDGLGAVAAAHAGVVSSV